LFEKILSRRSELQVRDEDDVGDEEENEKLDCVLEAVLAAVKLGI
jgi:hypothetical protein